MSDQLPISPQVQEVAIMCAGAFAVGELGGRAASLACAERYIQQLLNTQLAKKEEEIAFDKNLMDELDKERQQHILDKDELLQQLSELKRDKERYEWMKNNYHTIQYPHKRVCDWQVFSGKGGHGEFDTFEKAIDSAIQAQTKETKP